MAGVITNIIKTLFTTSGADDAAGAADRVGRAQTRLGNSSASAGRQFAAQASGMGGLVGAYAGAAATVIALTSAYAALTKAAQAQQTLVGLNALAADSALNGEALLSTVQKITKGQLAMADAAGNINLALSAGFSGKQIEGLSSVALKASRALGRDLTDSMTRVVRGSAKMEAELLDELGIYTKIGPATRAYAASLGVNVTALTEFQRRQAFANAVIAEGQRKFSAISTVVPTTSEKLQAFGATISNITTQITMFIADALAPLASFLTSNLGASFGAVALAATLVFARALSLLQGQIKVFGQGVDAYAGRLSDRILKAGALTTQKLGAARTAIAGISGNVKGTTGIGNDITDLKKIAGERNLNTQELSKANTVLTKRIDNLKTLRAGEMAQVAALKAQRTTLTAGTQAYVDNEKAIARVYSRIQASNKLLTSTRTELAAVTAATNTSAAGFARLGSWAVKATGGALIGVAKLATGMVSLASKAISIVAIFGLVGSAIANAMGKGDEFNALVKKLGSAIKGLFTSSAKTNAKNVFQGTSAAILTSMEATDASLKNIDSFKFKTKFLYVTIDVEKTKEQIVSEVSTIMADLATGNTMNLSDAILTQRTGVSAAGGALGGAVAGAFAGSVIPGIGTAIGAGVGLAVGAIGLGLAGAYSNVGNVKYDPDEKQIEAMKAKFASQLSAYDQPVQDQLAIALSYFQDQYGELAKMDPVVRSMLDTYSQLVIENGKYYKDVFILSDTMKTLGKDAAAVSKNFTFKTGIDDIDYLASATATLGDNKIEFKNFDIDTEAFKNLLESEPITINTIISSVTQKARDTMDDNVINQLTLFSQAVAAKEKAGSSFVDALARTINENAYPAISALYKQYGDLRNLAQNTNIGSAFKTAHGDITVVQADLQRGVDLLLETQRGIQTNSISFDQYTQNITNANAAVVTSIIKLATAYTSLEEAKRLAALAVNTDKADELNKIVAAEQARVDAIEAGIEVAKSSLIIEKARSAELKKQLELQDYLTSITPKAMSDVALGASIASAGSGKELQTQIQYAYAVVEANKSAIGSYNMLSSSLKMLTLDTTQFSQAMSATNQKDLTAALTAANLEVTDLGSGLLKVKDTVTGAEVEVNALDATIAKSADTGLDAMSTISGLMQTLAVDTAKFMNDKLTEYKKLITDAEDIIRQIAAKQIIVKAKFEIDMQNIRDQMASSLEQFKLDKLNLDISLIEAKKDNKAIKPVDAANQINDKQQEILRQQKEILVQQYQRDFLASQRADAILKLEAANAKAEIDAKTKLVTDQIDADTKFITASIDLYNAFILEQYALSQKYITAYVEASNGFIAQLVSVLTTGAASFATAISTEGASTGNAITGGKTGITTTPIDIAGTALSDMALTVAVEAGLAKSAVEEAAEARKTAIEEELQNNLTLSKERRDLLYQNYKQDVALLATRGEIESENAKKRVTDAENDGKEKDKLTGRLASLQSSINGAFENAFTSLYNLAITGNGNIKDIIGGLFQSIAEEVYKQTIATPLANIISNWVTGAINKISPTDFMGSKLSGVVGSAANATGDALLKNSMGDKAVDAGTKAVTQLGSKLSTAMNDASSTINGAALAGAQVVQGAGATLATTTTTSTGVVATANTAGATTLMSSLGPILAVLAVIAAIMALFGGKKGGASKSSVAAEERAKALAQSNTNTFGAIPRMASGGMMRDRVPALLEPGEFVIRKPIARKIGAANLAQMNATGNSAGSSAPTINIKNEGSPKTAEASPPRFDGEKYVIDVIMRDLSTNGPIRRSLRGGAL